MGTRNMKPSSVPVPCLSPCPRNIQALNFVPQVLFQSFELRTERRIKVTTELLSPLSPERSGNIFRELQHKYTVHQAWAKELHATVFLQKGWLHPPAVVQGGGHGQMLQSHCTNTISILLMSGCSYQQQWLRRSQVHV